MVILRTAARVHKNGNAAQSVVATEQPRPQPIGPFSGTLAARVRHQQQKSRSQSTQRLRAPKTRPGWEEITRAIKSWPHRLALCNEWWSAVWVMVTPVFRMWVQFSGWGACEHVFRTKQLKTCKRNIVHSVGEPLKHVTIRLLP